MSSEAGDGEPEHPLQLLQVDLTVAELGRVKRRLVIVRKQMIQIRIGSSQRRGQQSLGKNHACAEPVAIRTMIAFADAIESVARRDYPRVRGRTFERFAVILKDRRVLRRKRSEIIDGFVYACGQAGCGNVVAENSAIHHLREESGLRDKFMKEVRNILLTFGRKRLFVARSSAEGNNDGLLAARR